MEMSSIFSEKITKIAIFFRQKWRNNILLPITFKLFSGVNIYVSVENTSCIRTLFHDDFQYFPGHFHNSPAFIRMFQGKCQIHALPIRVQLLFSFWECSISTLISSSENSAILVSISSRFIIYFPTPLWWLQNIYMSNYTIVPYTYASIYLRWWSEKFRRTKRSNCQI